MIPLAHQDREAEPRFTGTPSRGDYGGGARGGYGGGYSGATAGGGGGRQIYVSNVCDPKYLSNLSLYALRAMVLLTTSI